MPEPPCEVEAKFVGSQRAFRALEQLDEIDGWRVAERREVRLRDTYWDTPDRRLGAEVRTLRVREMDGAATGELTLKGRPEDGGRTEETVAAPAGSGPGEWARLPGAEPILDTLRRLGVIDRLRPDVVLLNPRRELVLRRGDAEEVLSLDEMRIEGQPYRRSYVELELKHGDREGHDALVRAIAGRFGLRPSGLGKVHAARRWLERRAATPSS
jgi:hypothetical protein